MIGEQSIGRITKQQSDLIKTCITDASSFFIQFPMDMDVKMKAILLGACLFIVSIKPMISAIHCHRNLFGDDIFNCFEN